jgi:hypothetical protein
MLGVLSAVNAALRPRRPTGRAESAMLVAYGIVVAYLFGLLMGLWFWLFMTDVEFPDHDGGISSIPGDAILDNLHRFAVFTLLHLHRRAAARQIGGPLPPPRSSQRWPLRMASRWSQDAPPPESPRASIPALSRGSVRMGRRTVSDTSTGRRCSSSAQSSPQPEDLAVAIGGDEEESGREDACGAQRAARRDAHGPSRAEVVSGLVRRWRICPSHRGCRGRRAGLAARVGSWNRRSGL